MQHSSELKLFPGRSERLDVHLYKLFDLLQINCVLDVGANRGQYRYFLRDMGYTGMTISFEPVAEDFNELSNRCAKKRNWRAYCLALGDRDCTMQIHVTRPETVFNSFLKPNDYIVGQGVKVDYVEEVDVKRLDSIFEECISSIENPRVYLKMDTQGYDLKVLEGAQNSLKKILAFQSEVSVKPIYEGETNYLDAISIMSQKGFDLTGLFPVARDAALRVVEFDCVMVRRGAVGDFSSLYPP